MLLVTTAHPHTRTSDEPALLLGDWCRLEGENHDCDALPHHWNDREAFYADYLYLRGLNEKLFPKFAERLNTIHGTSHPLRYWRLVAGSWFGLCASVLLDRYRSIQSAAQRATGTVALAPDDQALIVQNGGEFVEAVCHSDVWNHHCYRMLIEAVTEISIRYLPRSAPPQPKPAPLPQKRLRAAVSRLTQLATRNNHIAALALYVPPRAAIKLAWRLRQPPTLMTPDIRPQLRPRQMDRRQQLAFTGDGHFEDLLGSMMPQLAPSSLVEDFAELRDHATAVLPSRPRVILTAQFHLSNDALCIWAAEKREQGAQMRVMQHGGHCGVDRFESQEDHEATVADRCYSWGWNRESADTIRPMPSMQLSSGRKVEADPAGHVAFVYDALPAFAYRMFCIPGPGQHGLYIDDQVTLLRALPDAVRAAARLRLHPQSDGFRFPLRRMLMKNGWGDLIDDGSQPMMRLLAKARLCVVTANATVFLQTLAMDYPTLMTWDSRYYEVRDTARPYFDALLRAGILHHSPQAAAAKIADIFPDVQTWWRSPTVQEIRQSFIDRYARTSPDWVDIWKEELLRKA